ncbi:hypothetical protein LTR67_011327 [Exophiala xenobiotica]
MKNYTKKSLEVYTDAIKRADREKDRLIHENRLLQTRIDQQTTTTQAVQQQLQTQVARAAELSKEKNVYEERAQSANQNVKAIGRELEAAKQHAKQLGEVLKQRDHAESRMKEEVKAAQAQSRDQQQRADKLSKQLQKISFFVVQTNDIEPPALIKELNEIWQTSLKLAKSVTAENLSEQIMKNNLGWRQALEDLEAHLPLPRSNSANARAMRAILVLSTLSNAFMRFIFTPTYLLPEAGRLDDILGLAAESSGTHETFVRSVLLRLFPDDEGRMIESRVAGLLEYVMLRVKNILAPEQVTICESGLKELGQKSALVWSKFQHNKRHLKVRKADNDMSLEWKILRISLEGEEVLEPLASSNPADVVVTVFPQTFSVDEVDDRLVWPGVVIVKSQLWEVEDEIKLERGRKTSTRSGQRAMTDGVGSQLTSNGFLGER